MSLHASAPRVRLEPLVAAHAKALHAGLCDPRLYAYTDDGPPENLEALEARYRRLESRRSPRGDEQWLNWAVWDVDGGAYVGYVQATVGADGVAHVAYVLFVAAWGRGLGTAAVAAMLDVLRERHGARAYAARIDARNAPSIALVERLGFRARERALPSDSGDRLFVHGAADSPPPMQGALSAPPDPTEP